MEPLAWELEHGNLGNDCLGTLAWQLKLGNFGVGILASEFGLGNFSLGTLACERWLGFPCLESFAWELLLRALLFGIFLLEDCDGIVRLGNFSWGGWGNLQTAAGGTWMSGVHLPRL